MESKIELSSIKEKSDNKVIKKDAKPIKPAFSTRNVLNIFSNNDLIRKIEGLKNHNKIIVNNKTNNVIDLSESKNKLKINISGNVNKENHDNNMKKALSKNNITNVININNNVTNNVNVG